MNYTITYRTKFSALLCRIIVLLVLSPVIVHGQEEITMDDFIYKAGESVAVQLEESKIEILESGELSYPILERLEVRTETNNFDLSEQEYSLRVLPNSFKETFLEEDIIDIDIELAKIEKALLLKNERSNRYKIILSQVFLEQKLNFLERVLVLNKQKMELFTQMASFDLPKINAIVDAESEIIELEFEILETQNDLSTLQNRINAICGGPNSVTSYRLNTDDFLAAAYVREHYEKILSNDPSINLKMLESSLNKDKSDIEQDLSEKRNNKLIKFFQFRYGGDELGFQQDQFSIGVGFLIPLKKQKRIDRAKSELDKLDLESEFVEESANFEDDKLASLLSLESDIQEFEILSSHLQNSIANRTLEAKDGDLDITPLGILALREHSIKLENKVIESEYRMYISYLESLDVFGLIEEEPFKNYFSYKAFGY